MNYDTLFGSPQGRSPRGHYVPALLVLLLVYAFWAFFVRNRTGEYCMVTLLYPAFMLHARRFHDMGRSAWMLIVPLLLLLGMFTVRLKLTSFGAQVDALLPPVALLVAAGFIVWACIGKGIAAPNRFGAPVAA